MSFSGRLKFVKNAPSPSGMGQNWRLNTPVGMQSRHHTAPAHLGGCAPSNFGPFRLAMGRFCQISISPKTTILEKPTHRSFRLDPKMSFSGRLKFGKSDPPPSGMGQNWRLDTPVGMQFRHHSAPAHLGGCAPSNFGPSRLALGRFCQISIFPKATFWDPSENFDGLVFPKWSFSGRLKLGKIGPWPSGMAQSCWAHTLPGERGRNGGETAYPRGCPVANFGPSRLAVGRFCQISIFPKTTIRENDRFLEGWKLAGPALRQAGWCGSDD